MALSFLLSTNYRYLQFIAGISSLKPLKISQPLLNNLKVQILVRYLQSNTSLFLSI